MRMRVIALLLLMLGIIARPQPPVGAAQESGNTSLALSATQARAVVTQYCVTCHNQRVKAAGLALDTLDFDRITANGDVWEKVVRKVRVGMMPPPEARHPDQATRDALQAWLEGELDKSAPNPGSNLIRRLNRTEYATVVRDLLALDMDPASLLPADDSAYGFDNNAESLGFSPLLLERYLTAAEKISALAVGDPSTGPVAETYSPRGDASQDRQIADLPVGTIGGVLARPTLPLDGVYRIEVKLVRTNLGVTRGIEYPHELEILVDGERVHLAKMGGDKDFQAVLGNTTVAGDEIDARLKLQLPLKAGPRSIGATFLYDSAAADPSRLQPYVRSSADPRQTLGYPHVERLVITGPFNATGPGDTPSRRKIFSCRPSASVADAVCANKILSTLVRLAFRGTATDNDLANLMAFYAKGRRDSTFEHGIQVALQRMLSDPKFVFRLERDPKGVQPGSIYRISDLELASRLSFFLWSSVPDDQLLGLATRGELNRPEVLEQQVRRMLKDPKSAALVSNFAGQWLYLRNLKNQQPNTNDFPDFDDNLRQAFQREAELFFESVIREDRNVLDLMTADYTFVNERLAQHYGIPKIYGSDFRRIQLRDETRKGLLGKGAILLVTSHADRTSPVVRGKWVLDNLLNTPPPPMPNDVPPLNESAERGGKILTMRERMEEHRQNPVCASCHKRMDPIGLALENFDAIGAWRTNDGVTAVAQGSPIDASGQLMDGTKVDGVVTLRQALLRRPEFFVQTAIEKLMVYGLGRGLNQYDMPVIRRVVRDSGQKNYRFSEVILGIVKSTPFQMRVAAAATVAAAGH